MADEIRINRAPQMQRSESSMPENMGSGMSSSSRSKMPWVVLILVVVVLIVLGVVFRDKIFNTPSATSGKSSGYQAVFLTNGQVYFGKLSHTEGQYATLEDIYYLQVTTPPGLQGSQSQASAQAQQQQQQLSLVKLGQELHGPVDSMQINRDQVLFYESMKEDGKVMQAIRQYQKNPPASSQGTTPPAATGTTPAPATTPVK